MRRIRPMVSAIILVLAAGAVDAAPQAPAHSGFRPGARARPGQPGRIPLTATGAGLAQAVATITAAAGKEDAQ